MLVQFFSHGDERFEAYTANLRLIVTSDIEKNRAVRAIMRASAHRMLLCNSPLISALLRCTTGVSGAIQLRFCTSSGNDEKGKNTPLKKNIGVINRVK